MCTIGRKIIIYCEDEEEVEEKTTKIITITTAPGKTIGVKSKRKNIFLHLASCNSRHLLIYHLDDNCSYFWIQNGLKLATQKNKGRSSNPKVFFSFF